MESEAAHEGENKMNPDTIRVALFMVLIGLMSIFALGADAFFETHHITPQHVAPELQR